MSWTILSSAYSAAHLSTVHNVAKALQDGFRIYGGLILVYEKHVSTSIHVERVDI